MKWVKAPTAVLRDIGISRPHDIDLELIAFTLNAAVIYEPLGGYEANIFGSNDRAVITVNSNSIPVRRRFSLSHEIGHWTNDRGKNLSIECGTSDLRQKESTGKQLNVRQAREARANTFASHLLMPDFMIEPEFSQMPVNMDTVRQIASTFRTSLTSSANRLIQITKHPAMIGLWSRDGARRWFDRSSSLSTNVWPQQRINNPSLQFSKSNDVLINDGKWLDEKSTNETRIKESVYDNGFDIIVLLSWQA